MKIPAHFPKWNKAIDGLDDPLKWVKDCERSRLPPGTVFPRVGQVWESLRECEVPFIAWCGLPGRCTLPGGTTRLGRGERVRVVSVDDPTKGLLMNLEPLRYDELHEIIVPELIRKAPGYLKYTLGINTGYLNERFRLVEDVA